MLTVEDIQSAEYVVWLFRMRPKHWEWVALQSASLAELMAWWITWTPTITICIWHPIYSFWIHDSNGPSQQAHWWLASKSCTGTCSSWRLYSDWHYSCHQIHYTTLWTKIPIKLQMRVMCHIQNVPRGLSGMQIQTRISAKCKNVQRPDANVPDIPVDLTSPPMYLQTLPGPPGAKQHAFRCHRSILTWFWKLQQV